MSEQSDHTPTLQQLLNALKKTEKWFLFGAMLGVPVFQLKKIELDHQKDSDRCKLELLQYWLDNALSPTWNKIVRALENTDQLTLAAEIKHKYLWSKADSEEDLAKSSSTSSSTPPSSPTDEIKAEIKADVAVVRNLRELEASFSHMLVQVKRFLVQNKCDLSDALLFLDSLIGSEDFIECENFDKLIRQLQRDHIDVFNVYILQQLVANFNKDGLTELIEAYNERKENFLKKTTVLEFQRAVVSRVVPILASGMAVVTIRVPKKMALRCNRTLKDIEELAMEGFEECHKKFIRLHAEPGSIIISWVFPNGMSDRLEQLIRDNAAVFKSNGVLEVTVGGRTVFPCTQQEDMASLQGLSKRDKSKLKQLYTKFYQQLVEAVSDPDTCLSLTTQLHSTSLLSEEKKAVLSSSVARGSSYLKVLGLEEEPHLVTVLMEKMSEVKQLQTLSENMSDWLRQEREQVVVDVEKLTSENSDLLARLQHCQKDLNTANELLIMREKTISGMIAVNRSDTDVKERDEMISHLKKELEEMRREGAESKEQIMKESEIERQQLQAEIERLKSKTADSDRGSSKHDSSWNMHRRRRQRSDESLAGLLSGYARSKSDEPEPQCSDVHSDQHKPHSASAPQRVKRESHQSHRLVHKIILIESTAPPSCPVELVPIPTDLMWKFVIDPDTPRYWVKLNDEGSFKPPYKMGIREHCAGRHHKNVRELTEKLEPIIRNCLAKEQKFDFWCDARLGRLAWRKDSDLRKKKALSLSDVCFHWKNKEFYTRTTTKTDEMIKKLRSYCSYYEADQWPQDTVTIRFVTSIEQLDLGILLDESPPGTFKQNKDKGCTYLRTVADNKTDFVCVGRSHDLRVASDCKRDSLTQQHIPEAAEQAIEKIARSVHRTDTGQLKMILKSGCVKVEHVRQKKSWNLLTSEHAFRINFYELKETNARPLSPKEDELVTLEHNTNQEIEVETTQEIRNQDMIPEILDRVGKLVNFALDVVDMAEECRDPDIPY